MRAKQGFTLIELLVVIAIIAALATMVTGGMSIARKKAMVAKARTGISTLKIALGVYHQQIGVYPAAARRGQPPRDDPEALFRALYTGNPRHGGTKDNHLEDWSQDNIGRWSGAYLDDADAIYDRPTEEQLMFEGGYTPCVLLDPWGRPFHYVEWDSQPRSRIQLPGGQLKKKGAVPFMIWSDGPDRANGWGKEDDVTSWSAK
ncbi:prepilin-type N-terminal cleavage/methylation domain-containing protein [Planctomycetota bacterium]